MGRNVATGINTDTNEIEIVHYTNTDIDVTEHFTDIQPTLVMTKSIGSQDGWHITSIGCSISELADKLDDKYDKEAVRKVLQAHFPEDFI
jgi:hypothetical protein